MRLWTIQHKTVYENILKNGCFSVEDKFTFEDFRDAYNWLTGVMKKRLGEPPTGVNYPIWAWHSLYGKQVSPLDPEFVEEFEYEKNNNKVLLELDIPESRVLLSDFEYWHCVLNNGYLSTAETDEEIDREWELYGNIPEKVEESWHKIFNVAGKDLYIQATFWEIRKEDIVSVTDI